MTIPAGSPVPGRGRWPDAVAGWNFDNSYARLPEPLFTRVRPTPVAAPRLVVFNEAVAAELGLSAAEPDRHPADDGPHRRGDAAALFAGNVLPPGADPIAQAYAGHQFGHFTNLGDGRAILLGEQLAADGRRYDVQLKGSGITRYSRGGDGRAALGPMLREYVISEALHALGIPTTRSLAVATTGEAVFRTTALPGAILTRVAASHVRVGTFQYAAALGDPRVAAALVEHAIGRHDPAAATAEDPAAAFLAGVVERQAALVARWLHVGFVHGVMNTDNMAVSGESIDFGPCAFLDGYDPATVFSSIDHQGRYAFGNQPGIAHWNLARLAESLLPLMIGTEAAAMERALGILSRFPARFADHHLAGARAKLGLTTAEDGDRDLFAALLGWMHAAGADFTTTFAALPRFAVTGPDPAADPCDAALLDWCGAWRARLARDRLSLADAVSLMRRVNPVVIPRNHRVEEALVAADEGDLGPLEKLLVVIRNPFAETAENLPYRAGPPSGCGPYRTFCGT